MKLARAMSAAWEEDQREYRSTPVGRHPDPNFAVHGSGEEGSLDVPRKQLVLRLGSNSEQSTNGDGLSNGSEGVVKVEALLHELTPNDDAELLGSELRLVDGRCWPAWPDTEPLSCTCLCLFVYVPF